MLFTPKHLQDYLSAKLGHCVIVTGVRQIGRGNSRETWFVEYAHGGTSRKLTFRLDHPSGPIVPTPLEQEYFMYERLGHTAVPVAKALWWEAGAPWSERPFYVREQVEGNWNVPHILDTSPEWDAYRIAISKEHLSKLALVHTADWRALGFDKWLPKPAGVADCAQTMVNSILQQYETARMEPIPIFLECAAWLKTNAPVAPCVSLCKGTNGLGEEIFNGGRIVAMSDWEEALIGDPSSDFAFTQGLIPEITRDGQHLWGLQPALAFYESKSGIKIDPLSVRYYGVVRALKLVLFAVKSARSVHEMPLQSELRQAWTAIEVGNVGKRLLAAAMGWGNPPAAHILEELNQSVEQVA